MEDRRQNPLAVKDRVNYTDHHMKPVTCISRRDFLRGGIAAVAACPLLPLFAQSETPGKKDTRKTASYYEALPDREVRCTLCPWQCRVPPGRRGRCGVRENQDGRYVSLVYGRAVTTHTDPVEKKPFFHVYPGSQAFSIATAGCNFDCTFCQNWDISQATPEQIPVPFTSPDEIADKAREQKARAVAYTYSEPTIFFEYMRDCAKAARERGLANLMISNGFIAAEPLAELCKLMTAIKVDFKAFSPDFYRQVCSGELQPVLDTLRRIHDAGVWLEVVNLVIPTLNDPMDDIKRMAAWLVKQAGPDVPLHFTRFHASYKIRNLPPTPIQTLVRARETAMAEGCRFVYTGNYPGNEGEHTSCPACRKLLVKRYGLTAPEVFIVNGKCPACQAAIPGRWS
jgi:pyruvate formate lyase activating enzyme